MPGQDLAIGVKTAVLEIQARQLVSLSLGSGRVMSTWLFHGAEQLWGGAGCQRSPESTMLGLGWHCHKVTPRLLASGASAQWAWVLPRAAAAPGAGPGTGHPPPVARGCCPQGWERLYLSVGPGAARVVQERSCGHHGPRLKGFA